MPRLGRTQVWKRCMNLPNSEPELPCGNCFHCLQNRVFLAKFDLCETQALHMGPFRAPPIHMYPHKLQVEFDLMLMTSGSGPSLPTAHF